PTMKAADRSGAEATLRFRGTGLSVAGRCSQQGGRADVCLDGDKVGEIDAYVVPRTHDNDYWHVTALKSGEHTLRIVTRADKDERLLRRFLQQQLDRPDAVDLLVLEGMRMVRKAESRLAAGLARLGQPGREVAVHVESPALGAHQVDDDEVLQSLRLGFVDGL